MNTIIARIRHRYGLLFCCLLFFQITVRGQALPDSVGLRILVLRHAEKPDTGFNLSCRGYDRSRQLGNAIVPRFGVPRYVYVPDMRGGKVTKSVRMYQTVIPMAVKYNLKVNSEFDEKDSVELSAELTHKRGLVMVVWDKKNIAPLLRMMGVTDPDLNWHDNDYDSIWILDFKKATEQPRLIRFWKTSEGIVPRDKCD